MEKWKLLAKERVSFATDYRIRKMRCLQKMLPIVLLCHRSLPSSLWLGLGGQNINMISLELLQVNFLFVEKLDCEMARM